MVYPNATSTASVHVAAICQKNLIQEINDERNNKCDKTAMDSAKKATNQQCHITAANNNDDRLTAFDPGQPG